MLEGVPSDPPSVLWWASVTQKMALEETILCNHLTGSTVEGMEDIFFFKVCYVFVCMFSHTFQSV